ncbi:hypothetical protein C0J50_4145 [Silurus asotus]|uniref:Uncharacterized protein n=1 Tax=Silurus asotus TaxID=30991 RepID=A0AAD5ACL0_SILAS|nr:hypothetical protein C0J50_4145 [Silurus asotus]
MNATLVMNVFSVVSAVSAVILFSIDLGPSSFRAILCKPCFYQLSMYYCQLQLVKASLVMNVISAVAALGAFIVFCIDLYLMRGPLRVFIVFSVLEICMAVWTFILIWKSRDSIETIIVQIVIGIMILLFGFVLIGVTISPTIVSGIALWGPIIMKASLVMNVISAVAAGLTLILFVVDMLIGDMLMRWCYNYDYYNYRCNSSMLIMPMYLQPLNLQPLNLQQGNLQLVNQQPMYSQAMTQQLMYSQAMNPQPLNQQLMNPSSLSPPPMYNSEFYNPEVPQKSPAAEV